MDAHARLHAARLMTREGRYEDALREFAWFHEHALEENRALYGVRLSSALSGWADLAGRYPPARHALEGVRERGATALLAGQGGFPLFHEIASIDEALGEQQHTHALFARMMDLAPDRARSLINVALPAVIAARDFALAERMLPDPEQFVREHCDMLLRLFRHRRRRLPNPEHLASIVDFYARDVGHVLAMLEGRGRRREAARIRMLATDLIHATTLRRTVRAALLPGARPWFERGTPRPRRRRIS
jgi:hypothetical protein